MSRAVLALCLLVRQATSRDSLGCSAAPPPGAAVTTFSLEFDGDSYSHDVHNDAAAAGPKPLLLYFHGLGQDKDSCGTACTKARNRGFVAVALQGIGEAGGANSWSAPLTGSTAKAPGPDGVTCAPGTRPFCGGYESCGADALCFDDDACIQAKPGATSAWTCAGSAAWCDDPAWGADTQECCPATCGLCPGQACLQGRGWEPGWGGCSANAEYCSGWLGTGYGEDMMACCAETCAGGLCPGDLACVWTTCKDSVRQALDVYQYVVDRYCVDLDAVWVTGPSNGGVFSHELAYDPRSRGLLAGIVPVIGLPHNGYNRAPVAPMHYFGAWGRTDALIPPEGVGDAFVDGRPDKSFDYEFEGWYWSTSKNTTDLWGATMGCGAAEAWPMAVAGETWTCESYPRCATGKSVVGCIFDGGHASLSPGALDVVFDFIAASATTSPPTPQPSPQPTPQPSPQPTPQPGTSEPTACEDDTSWSWTRPNGREVGCAWVARRKPDKRCRKPGAAVACCVCK